MNWLADVPAEEVAFVNSLAQELGLAATSPTLFSPRRGEGWQQSIGKYFGQERLRDRLRMVFE